MDIEHILLEKDNRLRIVINFAPCLDIPKRTWSWRMCDLKHFMSKRFKKIGSKLVYVLKGTSWLWNHFHVVTMTIQRCGPPWWSSNRTRPEGVPGNPPKMDAPEALPTLNMSILVLVNFIKHWSPFCRQISWSSEYWTTTKHQKHSSSFNWKNTTLKKTTSFWSNKSNLPYINFFHTSISFLPDFLSQRFHILKNDGILDLWRFRRFSPPKKWRDFWHGLWGWGLGWEVRKGVSSNLKGTRG